MKLLPIAAMLLLPSLVRAETIIVEYPDHYYVESTGAPGKKAPQSDNGTAAPVARPAPPPFNDSNPLSKPVTVAERKKALTDELSRLQREHDELTTPRDGDTPDQISNKQQAAHARLMKIKRITSVLQKMSDSNQ